jgi:predicted O-methyltransferase YrrM
MSDYLSKIEKVTKSIHGWLTPREGRSLFTEAKEASVNGPIVEISSWCGKSTIWLGKGAEEKEEKRAVYAVDPHTGASEQKERHGDVWTFPQFKENIKKAGLEKTVEPLVMTSKQAAEELDENPAFVFIDGAHEYEMVLLDLNLWASRIPEGGRVAFHDTMGQSGPTRVVREKVYFSSKFKDVSRVDSITFATKTKGPTAWEWCKKAFQYLKWEINLTIFYRISFWWGVFKWHAFRKWKKKYID